MMNPTSHPPAPVDGTAILGWAQRITNWMRGSRAVAGQGLIGRQTSGGYILSVAGPQEFHPFQIVVRPVLDSGDVPIEFQASVHYGTIQGTDDGIYTGVPLYEGSGGSLMTTPPAVEYDLGTTNQTNRLYAVVTVNPAGEITDVWLKWFTASQADTVFVPDDFPDPGDTGTDGLYHHLIGTVTISGSGAAKTYAISQSVFTSLTFLLCGSAGDFYAA